MTNPYGQPGAYPPVGPAPQQPYAYAGAYPAPRSPKTTLGMWSLILGISGFLVPIGINSVAAIVLGIVGIVKEQRRGLSIAGLSVGAFVLLIYTPFIWSVLALLLSLTPLLFLPFLY
ncbi:DUF4190 domain-containing protein [Agrococcus sp. SGAir0287]|uniref:DUF4190 domain-containing protein n=1 Tax=Agrococcus sp. SGAir0287 TaxID=2070347 RepID=UPI0010CD0AE8|nr:DUF4190 domain-containing protein [Agrococcus sp. SGAir0287]QCR18374.1 hypothetical protein C1N71_01990 [Agrococcus sp. SGAir0287]